MLKVSEEHKGIKVGSKYGRLTMIGPAFCITRRDTNGLVLGTRWLVVAECECGVVTVQRTDGLQSGHSKSCGCFKREVDRAKNSAFTHGHTCGKKSSRLYNSWRGMLARCYDPKHNRFDCYGARGIVVCDAWRHDFQEFARWAYSNGYVEGLTIERREVNESYSPGNCRWATLREQASNKRNTVYVIYKGERITVKALSQECGIQYDTLKYRIRRGWPIEQAVAQKPRNGGRPRLVTA